MESQSLPTSLAALVSELRFLREDVRAEANQRRRMSVVTLAAAVLMLIFMALQITVAYQNGQISRQIADCTTEGGRCYEQGQRRTGKAVQEIVRGNVAVHRCLETTDTDAELEACVTRKLAGR